SAATTSSGSQPSSRSCALHEKMTALLAEMSADIQPSSPCHSTGDDSHGHRSDRAFAVRLSPSTLNGHEMYVALWPFLLKTRGHPCFPARKSFLFLRKCQFMRRFQSVAGLHVTQVEVTKWFAMPGANRHYIYHVSEQ